MANHFVRSQSHVPLLSGRNDPTTLVNEKTLM